MNDKSEQSFDSVEEEKQETAKKKSVPWRVTVIALSVTFIVMAAGLAVYSHYLIAKLPSYVANEREEQPLPGSEWQIYREFYCSKHSDLGIMCDSCPGERYAEFGGTMYFGRYSFSIQDATRIRDIYETDEGYLISFDCESGALNGIVFSEEAFSLSSYSEEYSHVEKMMEERLAESKEILSRYVDMSEFVFASDEYIGRISGDSSYSEIVCRFYRYVGEIKTEDNIYVSYFPDGSIKEIWWNDGGAFKDVELLSDTAAMEEIVIAYLLSKEYTSRLPSDTAKWSFEGSESYVDRDGNRILELKVTYVNKSNEQEVQRYVLVHPCG